MSITCVATLEGEHGHRNWVNSVAFHPELPLLATGSNDWTAKLWSFNPLGSEATNMSATCIATLEGDLGHRNGVTSVAFHPKLPLLATSSIDMTAKLWSFDPSGLAIDNMSAKCVATLDGDKKHSSGVYSVAFHRALPLLATGSKDRTAKLWRFNPHGSKANNMSATCVATLGGDKGHRNFVTSVAFHPTLPILVTGSNDRTAKLWSFNPDGSEEDNMSAKCVATLQAQSSFPRNCFRSVAFHPTLPILATGTWDNTAKLWSFNPDGSEEDNMSATCVATLGGDKGHRNLVTSVAFHPELPLLATGSEECTAKLWRCKILELYNDFILYRKKKELDETVCNKLCDICNFHLCKKNPSNDNNSNGYVIKLTTGDLTKDIHVHYNCLHFQLITNKTEIDDIPISSGTIQRILNIDDKMDALIGNNFYN
jgi:WD40 repeat protein